MSLLEQLLILQEHDTTADQLQYRRGHLPERAQLAEIEQTTAAQQARRAELDEQRGVMLREQRRIEDEIAGVETKKADTDRALYSGTVTAPRELQSLQDELKALARRQEMLEDELLEILTGLEPLDEQMEALAAEESETAESEKVATAALNAEEARIDAELTEVNSARSEVAAAISAEQLAEYETKRRQLGGIAVARLQGGSCGGCHLRLSAVELDRIRKLPADEPAICEECGRLLVH